MPERERTYCEPEDVDYLDDGVDDEWQPFTGQCDHCSGGAASINEPFAFVCACLIGQGADASDCVCGPGLFLDSPTG